MSIYQFGENIKIIFMAFSAISELKAEKLFPFVPASFISYSVCILHVFSLCV